MSPFHPSFTPTRPSTNIPEPPSIQNLLKTLNLQPHPEGGYFVETDRDHLRIPNPFLAPTAGNSPASSEGEEDSTRSASITIFYLLTPRSPWGHFHRNKARTIHNLHRGRGRYVVIHTDELEPELAERGGRGKARVETFVVGHNVEKGERVQWVVEGGRYKASFLVPDLEGEGEEESGGLLISETVVPGFEFSDHDFLEGEKLRDLVTEEQAKELSWLLRKQ